VITHGSLAGSPWTRSLDIAKGSGVGNLAANVVTTAKLADAAVIPAKIATATILTANILDTAVDEAELATSAASARTLAANSIDTPQLQVDSVDARVIANNAVTNAKVAPGAVGTSEIIDGSVTAGKWAASAISTRTIVDDEVLTDHIGPSAVIAGKFAPNTLAPTDFDNNVLPAGTILPFAYAEADLSVWYPCDGRLYNHNILTNLYAACGWTYGSGVWEGITYPKVPDFQGRAVFGAGGQYAQGVDDGAAVANRKPKHSHSVHATLTSTGSSHAHFVSTAVTVDLGKGGGGVTPLAGMPWREYRGLSTVGSPGGQGNHSHTFTGNFGDTAGPLDSPAFQVLKYHIKVI
jgi:microcystin-dependent protein